MQVSRYHILTIPTYFLLLCSLEDYTENGKWNGSSSINEDSCKNAKSLFESIVAKPEDLTNINYRYFDRSVSSIKISKYPGDVWSYVDTPKYGRCYTANPTAEMLSYGIREIQLQTWRAKAIAFFHTPGMFKTANQLTYQKMSLKKNFAIEVQFTK